MGNFGELVVGELPGLCLLAEEPMEKHTTFRIGGPAEYYAMPRREELLPLLGLARSASVPVTVIGRGSNLLVADAGVRGLVVEIGERMSAVRTDGDCIVAEAGALLSAVAQTAAAAGLGGLEFAAGIPGNLGGAIVMNAGAYGGEMKDVVESVTVLDQEGQFLRLDAGELKFGYRHSVISEQNYLVVEAALRLTPNPVEEIRARMLKLREKRLEKQPLEYPSAGSTFKRPEGHYAGKLIMEAGLGGHAVGGAQVSEKHCGFVVNRGGATAADVWKLMRDVQDKVEEVSGVRLEPEVKIIGDITP